jgi:hypothetical protein
VLSQIDQDLFSDCCEVVELPLSQQHVFLIFKNASSSLRHQCQYNKGFRYFNNEITKLTSITVYLRDPVDRYISGASTFVSLLDQQGLDKNTVLYFIKKYNFLNNHYLPQFHWLLNLSRFLNSDCRLVLKDIAEVVTVTEFNDNPYPNKLVHEIHAPTSLNAWFHLDNVLRELIGQKLTFGEIVNYIKTTQPELWELVFVPVLALHKPLWTAQD